MVSNHEPSTLNTRYLSFIVRYQCCLGGDYSQGISVTCITTCLGIYFDANIIFHWLLTKLTDFSLTQKNAFHWLFPDHWLPCCRSMLDIRSIAIYICIYFHHFWWACMTIQTYLTTVCKKICMQYHTGMQLSIKYIQFFPSPSYATLSCSVKSFQFMWLSEYNLYPSIYIFVTNLAIIQYISVHSLV